MGDLTPKILELVARLSGREPSPEAQPAQTFYPDPALRPGVPGFAETVAETVARLVGMPLPRFEREGCPLGVRVPWLTETLWFVPTKADVEALAREGVSRGRVWTAKELIDLLSIPTLSTGQVQTIAQAKLEFGGEVVEVLP